MSAIRTEFPTETHYRYNPVCGPGESRDRFVPPRGFRLAVGWLASLAVSDLPHTRLLAVFTACRARMACRVGWEPFHGPLAPEAADPADPPDGVRFHVWRPGNPRRDGVTAGCPRPRARRTAKPARPARTARKLPGREPGPSDIWCGAETHAEFAGCKCGKPPLPPHERHTCAEHRGRACAAWRARPPRPRRP